MKTNLRATRRTRTDLLTRPPCGSRAHAIGWAALVIDQVEQLRVLATLRARGLLTDDEFELQKTKVIRSGDEVRD